METGSVGGDDMVARESPLPRVTMDGTDRERQWRFVRDWGLFVRGNY